MKKVLMSLLLAVGFLGFNMEAKAAPANSAFTDDNFYRCVVDNWYAYYHEGGDDDGGDDGDDNEGDGNKPKRPPYANYDINLTDEDLASIGYLDCSNRDIKDVSGIEKLTNLYYLDLDDNQISHINLSKNIYLETLYFDGNKCSCIDLSKNRFLIIDMLWHFAPKEESGVSPQESWDPQLAYEEADNYIKHLKIEYGEDLDKALAKYKEQTGMNVIIDSDGNSCEVKSEVVPVSNKVSTDKNPKTGLSLPITAGVCALVIMFGAFTVVRKKNLFRNI